MSVKSIPTYTLLLCSKNCDLQSYTFFRILFQNIDCGYSLEPPDEAVLTSTHNQCFVKKKKKKKREKYIPFSTENYHFTDLKIPVYFMDMLPYRVLGPP